MIFTADNPANPIRLVKIKTHLPGKYFYQHFDDNLAYDLIPDFQSKQCYFQKYTSSDKPIIQILSDYEDFTLELYDILTNALTYSFTVTEVPTSILNETFKCYESIIDFALVPEGDYQLIVTNEDDVYHSEPISVKAIHENTVLIEYSNSENDFSMILEGDYVGQIRVEAAILNFKPASDDVIYNDQKRNSATIYSLPYRQFQFFLGGPEGLPDWMVDKVNRAFSFNILSLDGKEYNKIDGAKFEEKRVEDYPYSGQVITIMPVDNSFLKKLNTSGLIPDDEDMIQFQKVLKYLSNASDITISDKMRDGILLEKICIVNRGIDFDLRIKTVTTGADDDIDFTSSIEGITTTVLVNQLFSSPKTIEISGLDSIDTDVYVLYKDFLAKPSGVQNPYGSLGVGAVCIYDADTMEQYNIDWNFGTGLGREGTSWEGWQILEKYGERFPMGYKTGSSFATNLINNIGGAFNIAISISNLPSFSLKYFRPRTNAVGTNYEGNTLRSGSDRGLWTGDELNTNSIGGNVPITHKQPYVVSLFVKKIAEV